MPVGKQLVRTVLALYLKFFTDLSNPLFRVQIVTYSLFILRLTATLILCIFQASLTPF